MSDTARVSGSTRLDGVRAVVTGATSGLGAAMVDALGEAGATVMLAARPGVRLKDAVEAQRARAHEVYPLPMDVRDPDAVERAVREAIDQVGTVDLVVNNAGVGMRKVNPQFHSQPKAFFEVSPADFADLVATNLTGYFLVARAFAPHLVARGAGQIVNVTINYETMIRQGFVPYGPSRAGSEALSRVMTEDLRPFGVRVNLLLPGGITDTGMIPEEIPPEERGRMLSPHVMGPPIVYLASPAAATLTGARIVARDFQAWLDEHH